MNKSDDLEFTWSDEPPKNPPCMKVQHHLKTKKPPRPRYLLPIVAAAFLVWIMLLVVAYNAGKSSGHSLAEAAIAEAVIAQDFAETVTDEAEYWKHTAEEASRTIASLERKLTGARSVAETPTPGNAGHE